jgi:inorganic pyrophosphatase
MDKKVKVYIEIEKDSNLKFEYNHNTKNLELDRILQEPFVYPYPYGFILNTKAKDDDELDALFPSTGYRILDPPPSYVPIRTPQYNLMIWYKFL